MYNPPTRTAPPSPPNPYQYRYSGPWMPAPGSVPTPPPAPPPAGPLRKVLRALGVVAMAVGIVAVGGAVVLRQEITDAIQAARTSVVAPSALPGRPRATDPKLQQIASHLEFELRRTLPGVRSSAGGYYASTPQDLVLVMAAALRVGDERQMVDDLMTALAKQGVRRPTLVPVAAGTLGGSAECGTSKDADGVPTGICVWADSGSVGMITMAGRTATQAAGEFLAIRALIEHR